MLSIPIGFCKPDKLILNCIKQIRKKEKYLKKKNNEERQGLPDIKTYTEVSCLMN